MMSSTPHTERVALHHDWGHASRGRAYVRLPPASVNSTALSAEAAQSWYTELASDAHRWVIEAKGRCIGQVRLHGLDLSDRRGRLAIGLLAPELLGWGYGTEATRLVLGHEYPGGGVSPPRTDLGIGRNSVLWANAMSG